MLVSMFYLGSKSLSPLVWLTLFMYTSAHVAHAHTHLNKEFIKFSPEKISAYAMIVCSSLFNLIMYNAYVK